MKNPTLRFLYEVPGRKKLYILVLTLVQALHGASGVFYALLLRNIVDAATAKNSAMFWNYLLWTGVLILCQLGLRAIIRWMGELA